MDCSKTKNYLEEKARMIKSDGSKGCGLLCEDCPISRRNNGMNVYCGELQAKYPDKAIAIVQKWSNEHPQKTILQDFLEKYPDAALEEGVPNVCLLYLGYPQTQVCKHDCINCWSQPLK